jgi:HlyD family secretion protein
VWIDTVKKGSMAIQVRGLGTLADDENGRFKADLRIPITVAHDLELGQRASIDTHGSILPGIVSSIKAGDQSEVLRVGVRIDGDIPTNLNSGAPVDGTIDVTRLDDVLYVGRPVRGQGNSTVSMFKLDEDGQTARRVLVKLGRSSVNTIHIVEGLNEGDRVILSDTSAFDGAETLRLR